MLVLQTYCDYCVMLQSTLPWNRKPALVLVCIVFCFATQFTMLKFISSQLLHIQETSTRANDKFLENRCV